MSASEQPRVFLDGAAAVEAFGAALAAVLKAQDAFAADHSIANCDAFLRAQDAYTTLRDEVTRQVALGYALAHTTKAAS